MNSTVLILHEFFSRAGSPLFSVYENVNKKNILSLSIKLNILSLQEYVHLKTDRRTTLADSLAKRYLLVFYK